MLMEMLEASGLITYVGKVNMDREAPKALKESDAETSLEETREWISDISGKFPHTKPIITPRFLISCTDELLEGLGKIAREFDLPVQSHLSENTEEVKLVQKLFPAASCYGDGYDMYGLFGKDVKTVMAHCVYSTDEEVDKILDNGVFVAHCPTSNMNLASGIAPIRKYLNLGIKVGIGTDIGAGESESMFRALCDAIQGSKLYSRLVEKTCKPLAFEEAFFLATMGGGEFFGKVGSFEKGYEFDAVVIDDFELSGLNDFPLRSRLERAVYLEADTMYLVKKFVNGREVKTDYGNQYFD